MMVMNLNKQLRYLNDNLPTAKVAHERSLENIDEDKITRIFACATMWHETPEEMMEFLKSIFRMDEDQAAHRIVKQYLDYPDEGYYEWESRLKKLSIREFIKNLEISV